MTKIEKVEEVARRLKGLRDSLDLTPDDFAKACGVSTPTYVEYESGSSDIPISFIHSVAHQYGVELSALLFDEDPKMNSYFVTRSGRGARVERTKAYSYQSLAAGFAHRVMDPFMVLVEPDDKRKDTANSHEGQEFNYVVEGRLELRIGGNKIILETGDSVMFNAKIPHGMRALDDKPVRFIAIIS